MVGRLFRPVRVLDDVDEVGPLVAGDESLEDVGFDVAEGGLRLGGDAFGERPQDVGLEVGPGVQGGGVSCDMAMLR